MPGRDGDAMLRAAGDMVGAALVLGSQRDLPAAALAPKDQRPSRRRIW